MTSSRLDALRRLGGPVCPVCDTVFADAEDIAVHLIGPGDTEWLRGRGRMHIVKEGLAPMCTSCARAMTDASVARRAAEAESQAKAKADMVMMARPNPQAARMYRAACDEHQDDMKAAMDIGDAWGIGSGLFGKLGD